MTDKPARDKPIIHVGDLAGLKTVVDRLIATGTTAELKFSPEMLLDERAWQQLERLTTEHPDAKVKEVVSYAEGALEDQEHRGITYKVVERAGRFEAHVHQGCAGWFQPWDFDFESIADADQHATAYIDQMIADAEEAGRAAKAKAQAEDYDTFST